MEACHALNSKTYCFVLVLLFHLLPVLQEIGPRDPFLEKVTSELQNTSGYSLSLVFSKPIFLQRVCSCGYSWACS